ncbi:MAG: hypothetical protein KatS3mg014_1555 [Actinomycetota bacterium]|nr:MAG: hypothetical protein KatS3mg014_1555 [Actinomycetota bacterium]
MRPVDPRARVAIIGGGIGGVSLAYHLAELGWTDVVVLEKGELASGSTWHAAGLCTHFNASRNLTRLLADSIALYKRLEAEGRPTGFREVGSVRLASAPDRMDEYRHAVGRAKVLGLPFELVDRDRIRELCPLLELDDVLGGLWIPIDGYADPSSVTNALAGLARERGVRIERRTRVTALRPAARRRLGRGDRPRGASRPGSWWTPPACGPGRSGRMAGVELPIVPLAHHYLVTDAVPELAGLAREIPVIRDPERSFYLRAEGEGLVVGPFEPEAAAWAVEGVPWDFEQQLLPEDLPRIEGVLELATERVPALARVGIRRVVNGPDGYTPDGRCLMGWVPGVRDLFVLAGFSIFGIVFGGGAGKYAAEWIVEGRPSIDLWEVDVRRFGPYAATEPYLVPKALDVYGHEYAIHYPHQERPAGRPVKTDPLYDRLRERGAVMGFRFGWERPLWFAPPGVEPADELTFRTPNWLEHVAAECRAVRGRVGVLDQTSFAKYEVRGPGAFAFLDRLCANRLPERDGRIVVTQMLDETGGIQCDLTLTRLAEDRWYVVSAAATEAPRPRLDLAPPAGGGLGRARERDRAVRGAHARGPALARAPRNPHRRRALQRGLPLHDRAPDPGRGGARGARAPHQLRGRARLGAPPADRAPAAGVRGSSSRRASRSASRTSATGRSSRCGWRRATACGARTSGRSSRRSRRAWSASSASTRTSSGARPCSASARRGSHARSRAWWSRPTTRSPTATSRCWTASGSSATWPAPTAGHVVGATIAHAYLPVELAEPRHPPHRRGPRRAPSGRGRREPALRPGGRAPPRLTRRPRVPDPRAPHERLVGLGGRTP